ncbi:dopamine beta-hydroxylase-like isoform X2 [Dreissena polymorpha]|uniref:Uncharacterized protein n=2 Tax=Dreissena polymorpha TaxID=45954 RepID=A0A9D4HEF3_DREPO|nr:dopamine beta-hydroxylase-like isoform X2 [Dreissena polymorpha]KAH3716267.1 hypothetical protein DPMN_058986 [Dreissena polymorpha]
MFCLLATFVTLTSAYSSFRNSIPNGNNVRHPCNASLTWAGVGHENQGGGGARNPFGIAWKANGLIWNSAMCMQDSDEDGRTNGMELGDPNCTWSSGKTPSFAASGHPGICEPINSPTCQQKNTFLNCGGPTKFDCPAADQTLHPDVITEDIRLAAGTKVPAQETTYMCQGFNLSPKVTNGSYHMIAVSPLIVNTEVAHHIIVRGCSVIGALTEKHTNATYQCFMGDNVGCNDIIALWTVGNYGMCYPNEIGFPVGIGGYTQLVFEIHWHNPYLLDSYVDNSGIRLYLTPNKRPNDAGVFFYGPMDLHIPPMMSAHGQTGFCSGNCTARLFNKDVQIVGAFNHMHNLGSSALAEIIRHDTGEAVMLARDDAYDYNSPAIYMYKQFKTFRPGDTLTVNCVFNSMSRTTATKYGEGTLDEMCFTFLIYYPKSAARFGTCFSYDGEDTCQLRQCTDEVYQQLGERLWKSCPLTECTEDCKKLTREFQQHPCLTAKKRNDMVNDVLKSPDAETKALTFEFVMRFEICKAEIAREDMATQCGGGSINAATSFSGSLISVFAAICIGSLAIVNADDKILL